MYASSFQRPRSVILLIISQFLAPTLFLLQKIIEMKMKSLSLAPLHHLSVPVFSLLCLILSEVVVLLSKTFFFPLFCFRTVGMLGLEKQNLISTNKNKFSFIPKGVIDP